MKGPRAIGYGLLFGLTLAVISLSGAEAQVGPPGNAPGTMQGRVPPTGANPNRAPLPDQSISPRTEDPEAYDAIDLYSRLCVSTRGDRARAIGIIGDGDSAIEKMDAPLLRGMENGQSGGIGWIIRMPLGDRILLEFPAGGACVVRAPRVRAAEMETAFRNLLDQFAGNGQFTVHRIADQTKTIDPADKPGAGKDAPAKDTGGRGGEKLKFHILGYRMTLPDSDKQAELVLATTDSQQTGIQANLSFTLVTEGAETGGH